MSKQDLFSDRDIANWKARLVIWGTSGTVADSIIRRTRPVASDMACVFAIDPMDAVARLARGTEEAMVFLVEWEAKRELREEADPRARLRVAWDNFLYAIEQTAFMRWLFRRLSSQKRENTEEE